MNTKKVLFYSFLFLAVTVSFRNSFSMYRGIKCINYTQSKFIESNDICCVENFIDNSQLRPLLIYDIDNTLVRAQDVQARDEYFSARLKREMESGKDLTTACNIVLPQFFECMKKTAVSLVDERSVGSITRLQRRGIAMIALTARSPHVLEVCTLKQLARVGINFRITSPAHENDLNFTGMMDKADFKGGVVFCGNNDKGAVLERLFEQTGFIPDKIIFVDDKLKNLENVEREALKLHIPFLGIRYSKLDAEIESFMLDSFIEESISQNREF